MAYSASLCRSGFTPGAFALPLHAETAALGRRRRRKKEAIGIRRKKATPSEGGTRITAAGPAASTAWNFRSAAPVQSEPARAPAQTGCSGTSSPRIQSGPATSVTRQLVLGAQEGIETAERVHVGDLDAL